MAATLILASGIPLAWVLRREAKSAAQAAVAAASLAEHATQFELAEQLWEIGRVSVTYPEERLHWSRQFCRLAGLDCAVAPSKETLADVLPQGLSQLCTTLDAHSRDREAFAVEFEMVHREKGERILHARAQNRFDRAGSREQVFLVVRDVTDEYHRIAQIEAAKTAALEKAENAIRLAGTDPLTGIANRRSAMAALDQTLIAARAEGRSVAVLIFDIDNFKAVNDQHGHAVGDSVLRRIAELAQRQARLGDCVARIGGEEFLWIMPGSDERRAEEAAEQLRWAVEQATALAPVPSVTVSVGWATLQPQDSSLALFSRADTALYAAKRAGRNRVRAAA